MIPALRRYARALARDADIADDLVQDTLVRALRSERLFLGGDVRSWLYTILTNLNKNRRRSLARRPQFMPLLDNNPDASGTEAEGRDISRALATLVEEQRAVLLLVMLEGLSYREVADIQGVPIGTVMSRLARARAHVKASLEGERAGAAAGEMMAKNMCLRMIDDDDQESYESYVDVRCGFDITTNFLSFLRWEWIASRQALLIMRLPTEIGQRHDYDRNIPVTEDELHAYVDNELPAERRVDVESVARGASRRCRAGAVVARDGGCVACALQFGRRRGGAEAARDRAAGAAAAQMDLWRDRRDAGGVHRRRQHRLGCARRGRLAVGTCRTSPRMRWMRTGSTWSRCVIPSRCPAASAPICSNG